MTHTWKVGGSEGRWVHHSSRESGSGSDSTGVGPGGDVIGPFSSRRLAAEVAIALTDAYQAGRELPEDTGEILDRAYEAMDPESSSDAEHESLLELTELVAALAGYEREPRDGLTLIAGMLYDEDGYEAEDEVDEAGDYEPRLDAAGNPLPKPNEY